MTTMPIVDGVIQLNSHFSVAATTDKIQQMLQDKGFTIFLTLDQQEIAKTVDLQMPATQVLIFGNPKIGTQLMNAYPAVALELPLKLVVQADADDTAIVSFQDPAYIAQRYHIDKPIFAALKGLIEAVC